MTRTTTKPLTFTTQRKTYGTADGDLPMTNATVRLPIAWLRAVRTRAAMDGSDQSKIIRQAIACWAVQHDVPLNGY